MIVVQTRSVVDRNRTQTDVLTFYEINEEGKKYFWTGGYNEHKEESQSNRKGITKFIKAIKTIETNTNFDSLSLERFKYKTRKKYNSY